MVRYGSRDGRFFEDFFEEARKEKWGGGKKEGGGKRWGGRKNEGGGKSEGGGK